MLLFIISNRIYKKNKNKNKIKSFMNKIINLTKGKKSSGNKNPPIRINKRKIKKNRNKIKLKNSKYI